MSKIPVTVLTGFLGSGKSTLLSALLRDPQMGDTAIIVNEFGDVGIDHDLVEHRSEQTLLLSTGCLCCTIRGDIRDTLLQLWSQRRKGRIPEFSRVIIETTGLADPVPALYTLRRDSDLVVNYALNNVVTTVDVLTGAKSLARYQESQIQAVVADRLVLTKSDMLRGGRGDGALASLRAELRQLNPGAEIADRHEPGFELRSLVAHAFTGPGDTRRSVEDWLGDAEAAGAHGDHDHDHDHDRNRHGPDIQTFSIVRDEPIDDQAFALGLDLLAETLGERVLRIKGIVNVRDRPGKPLVVHAVQHVVHDLAWLPRWPSEDQRTRLVFITRGVSRDTVLAMFEGMDDLADTGGG